MTKKKAQSYVPWDLFRGSWAMQLFSVLSHVGSGTLLRSKASPFGNTDASVKGKKLFQINKYDNLNTILEIHYNTQFTFTIK